tara:strand:+ start:137 stop:1162 length:1026 start_codon:yes stop_codon:yes gene_type:complete
LNDSKKSTPPKGDFIDLEKNQYKKNSKLKRYVIIFFSVLITFIVFIFYFNNYSPKIFSSQNFDNNRSNSFEMSQETSRTKEIQDDLNRQIIFLKENIDILKQEAADNSNKLSKTNKKISDLSTQLNNYESRKLVNSEFYYSEKYIILNSLLGLKNKFERRESFKKELDNLLSILNNDQNVKSIIINLQDLEIVNVITVENLLDKLNHKIGFYEEDIDRFINTSFEKTSREFNEILNSKENFIEYIKDIFNSTYKLTRVNEYLEKSENIPYEIYNFRKVLEKAKEYLIIGNLKRALDLLKSSNFDDNEIDIWVDDASDLYNAQEKLRSLEFRLLEIVGEYSD